MLLNGRLIVEDGPEPVKVDIIPGEDYAEEASGDLESFFERGYASSDDQVLESLVPSKSPLYSVEVLFPEDCIGEKTFPDEAYVGRSVEDKARMQGIPGNSEEVVERLEDGHIYLMAVAHASSPDVDPAFKVADMPLDAELRNRSENVEAMETVEEALDRLEYDTAFHDYTLWTDSFDSPQEAVKQASGTEMKLAATVYTPTPFHVDAGYLSSPQESGSEFGVEIRNKATEAVDRKSVKDTRNVVAEIVEVLETEGFVFEDKALEMEM